MRRRSIRCRNTTFTFENRIGRLRKSIGHVKKRVGLVPQWVGTFWKHHGTFEKLDGTFWKHHGRLSQTQRSSQEINMEDRACRSAASRNRSVTSRNGSVCFGNSPFRRRIVLSCPQNPYKPHHELSNSSRLLPQALTHSGSGFIRCAHHMAAFLYVLSTFMECGVTCHRFLLGTLWSYGTPSVACTESKKKAPTSRSTPKADRRMAAPHGLRKCHSAVRKHLGHIFDS